MNMVMPAEFEEEVKSIVESSKDKSLKLKEYQKLMERVLDSLGYGAGIRVFGDAKNE